MKAMAVLAISMLSLTCAAAPTDRSEAWKLLNARDFATLDPAFNEAQRRYEARYRDTPDAERTLSRIFRVFHFADESTGPIYDAWVKAYPRSYAASLARAEYLTALAWKRRSTEFVDKMSPSQWNAMREVAAEAVAELDRSLGLTPKPVISYEFLIELAMMMGGPDAAELLVSARKLDPAPFYASRAYLATLRPQWGGSLPLMREFVAAFRKSNPAEWKANCLDAMVADLEGSDRITPKAEDRLAAMTRAIDLCPQASRYDSRAYFHRQQKNFALAESDYRAALRLDSGDQWARGALGMLVLDHGKAEEGVALCREAAASLEPNAFQCLAYAYKFGKGVSKDANEVVRWLERSSASGQLAGMSDLAGYYWRGEGVPQNKGRAVELWRQAAAKGYAPAREKLKENGLAP